MKKDMLIKKVGDCDVLSALLTSMILVSALLIVVVLTGVTLYAAMFDPQSLKESKPPLYAIYAISFNLFLVVSTVLMAAFLKNRKRDLMSYILLVGKISSYKEMEAGFSEKEHVRVSEIIDSAKFPYFSISILIHFHTFPFPYFSKKNLVNG